MREREKKKAKNSDNRLLEKNDRPSIAIELPIPRERKKKNITFIRDERLLHSPARRSVPLKNHVPREKWRDERCERRSEKERERKKWGEKRWRRYKVRGAEALVVLPYYYSRPS